MSAPAPASSPFLAMRGRAAPLGRGDKSKNAEKKKQQQIAEAEARIASIETKLKGLGDAMQKSKGAAKMSSLSIEYALAQRELEEAMKQWEAVAA